MIFFTYEQSVCLLVLQIRTNIESFQIYMVLGLKSSKVSKNPKIFINGAGLRLLPRELKTDGQIVKFEP